MSVIDRGMRRFVAVSQLRYLRGRVLLSNRGRNRNGCTFPYDNVPIISIAAGGIRQ